MTNASLTSPTPLNQRPAQLHLSLITVSQIIGARSCLIFVSYGINVSKCFIVLPLKTVYIEVKCQCYYWSLLINRLIYFLTLNVTLHLVWQWKSFIIFSLPVQTIWIDDLMRWYIYCVQTDGQDLQSLEYLLSVF